jgi:AraC-like DNA-binding protein
VRDDNGSVTTELLSIAESGLTVGRVVSTGHDISLREAENITFLLPLLGRLDIQVVRRDYEVQARNLIAFRPTERRTSSSVAKSGTFLATTLQVPMDRMKLLAQKAGVSVSRAFSHDGMMLHGETGQLITKTLPNLVDDLFVRPDSVLPTKVARAVGDLMEEQLCEMIEIIAAQTASRRIFPAYHRVRQAEDMMHAQSDDPLSMVEVAQTLGVSLRSLQLAFNEVYDGQSPRDILNQIRLHKARERLQRSSGDGQVTRVALDSGFFHLSRFAQAYKKAFGERPSETLARRRA